MILKSPQNSGIEAGAHTLSLPEGLVGLPQLKQMEIVFTGDYLPFMWLRSSDDSNYSFLVVEPYGLINDYKIELSDADVEFLNIRNADDVLILNIATVHPDRPVQVTVNLVGPVIINRSTGVGKQVVIENYSEYCTHYLLMEEQVQQAVACAH
ncbi:MAG TPA: flagellar assembly protein FliW [Opitutales bacterium]|nr:flagellar assembly protein FliW [Opitutales bacterium]